VLLTNCSEAKGTPVSDLITIPDPGKISGPPGKTPPESPWWRNWWRKLLDGCRRLEWRKPLDWFRRLEWRKLFEWRPGPRTNIWLIASVALCVVTFAVFLFFYVKLARLADERLETGVFASTLDIYAAPRTVAVGDRLSSDELVSWLRDAGYNTTPGNPEGWYQVRPDALTIYPAASDTGPKPVVLDFSGHRIAWISAGNTLERTYQFAPQLITNLSDRNREKRRLVQFSEIPPALVDAVVSTEDKRFFSHGGFDLLRIFKAAYIDLKDGRKAQGASTLSMQLARSIFLEPDKKWKRKLAELLLTMHLEQQLTKQQIFTDYANQVYLGQRSTFSINGFGEAARAYFDKDISQLTVPESALLAGLVQRPSYYNPYRFPDRAKERRNVVLRLMLDDGRLTEAQYTSAVAAPLKLSAGGTDAIDSQYFLDLANEEIQNRLGERERGSLQVYTTLDPDLQQAAVEAVRFGMRKVDQQLRHARHSEPAGEPQVALIALDPHTGEIKALVGGRDYTASQLNHVTAERQPGSVFKPFVYAAALNTALNRGSEVFTPASTLDDEPTTFEFGDKLYSPGNFGQAFMGTVSLRQALAHSLNVATVSLAQSVGYGSIVKLARAAGLNSAIQPTPAVALGSYVCTPLEIAGAYTMFANGGTYVKPSMVAMVRSRGKVEYQNNLETRRVLDSRVNYLMVNLMEEVLRSGTGAEVRAMGFTPPAAGKTGTSRDGWFAGFTSRLLCIVWVGFDDYRELGLEGAHSALPIWTEFMKQALQYSNYRDTREFPEPGGVTSVKLCAESHQLATPQCPDTYTEVFLDGTQPSSACPLHHATLTRSSDSEDDTPTKVSSEGH
jgi:penicillin-binding protein 1B